ncbi:MAG TPA: maleylpyruvate isomerase family mycothiol-dependent enzyme [Thermopolyspora sp.]
MWGHDAYCDAVEAEIARFVAVIEEAGPATPVPTCPGWTIAKLAKHVGITHRSVEYMVRNKLRERVSPRDVPADLPADESGQVAWLKDGGARLVATLRAADPGIPVWGFGGAGHVRFWSRRMLHEITVHRADAELALGADSEIAPDQAVDGIEELLYVILRVERVNERLRELGGNGETLHLHATDKDGEWMITLRPEGFTTVRGHGTGTVAVRGTASDLLLLLYGRLKPGSRCAVYGDDALLTRWLEKSAV